jgi:primosomal protein N' (replication factor Y)
VLKGKEDPPVWVVPNEQQQAVINRVVEDFQKGQPETYLLKGVTGSGKTLVYIEIIEKVVEMGKEAIVLIPEIALTYQTVKRFRQRFGDRVTIMNSKLSKGERYDQFEKAKNGQVSVVIGPRSALFTPFKNLGIIVIDEEHEATYKSEYPPKYHAREVAIERARMCGASVILGSATPSVESYHHAMEGKYQLLTLTNRAVEKAELAKVSVVDLREELKSGNRGIFSRHLKELLADRLSKKQQTMLFINRRGFAGFISCRSCGFVVKCPHCDVSLTEHFKGTTKEKLVCHYCGYEQKKPAKCPECGSPYIAGFGIGTQKVEEQVKKEFPEARVLRMDMDTTRNKNDHETILAKFANGEADILVGTQMIVKGHDFSNVSLVGIIAADLTLFDNDYKSAERTFDLLTQAAGRAGRGEIPGEVVIQTYDPEHYCIETAANQDYEAFYAEEKAYRSLLKYPPFCHVLAVFVEHEQYEELVWLTDWLQKQLKEFADSRQIQIVGPCDATIVKMNDRYRRVVYFKQVQYNTLIDLKNEAERMIEEEPRFKKGFVTFDFDPVHGY